MRVFLETVTAPDRDLAALLYTHSSAAILATAALTAQPLSVRDIRRFASRAAQLLRRVYSVSF